MNTIQTNEDKKYKIGNISDKQKWKLNKKMEKYEDIFAKNGKDLGKTGLAKHTIDTGNHKPIKETAYRVNPFKKEVIEKEIKDMLEKGVIRRSNSPWSSPVTLVLKPNGKWRFCIDFRKLNGITRKDNHPLPRIDTILEKFGGSKWFSTMDMASGYWQIEMEEEDIEKTAFITHEGLYEWVVMLFGLTNAPATFKRTMQMVLGELFYTIAPVYIDDIIVHSKTFDEHLEDLEKVFR